MRISIDVKSSSDPDQVYEVVFEKVDGKVRVLCDCPAGEFGKLCKHKMNLVFGDQRSSGCDDNSLMDSAQALIQETTMIDFILSFESNINRIEAEQRKLKKEMKNLKNQLGRMLYEGFDLIS